MKFIVVLSRSVAA